MEMRLIRKIYYTLLTKSKNFKLFLLIAALTVFLPLIYLSFGDVPELMVIGSDTDALCRPTFPKRQNSGNSKEPYNCFDKTTIVLLCLHPERRWYYRAELIPHYGQLKESVDRILIVWTDHSYWLRPRIDAAHLDGVPIYIITAGRRSVNTRYEIYEYVKTPSVFFVDDDGLLSARSLLAIIEKWKHEPELFYAVTNLNPTMKDSKNKSRDTGSFPPTVKNAIAMMFHRKYLTMYISDTTLVEINENRFCDSVSLEALITNFTRSQTVYMAHEFKDMIDVGNTDSKKEDWECRYLVMQHFRPRVFIKKRH